MTGAFHRACRRRVRVGYTLIEMIGAMVASSLLLLSLASTIVVATSMVEPTDEDGRVDRDYVILDRLSNDLRYSTAIDATPSYGFSVTRPDLQGTLQSLQYESYMDGLTRQVSGGGAVELDPTSPGLNLYVDGYTAPTSSTLNAYPRIRSVSTAATDGSAVTSLAIDVPQGSKNGDLLVLIGAFRDSSFLTPTSGGWNGIASGINGSIRLQVFWRYLDLTTPRTQVVTFPGLDHASLAMLTIEKSRVTGPFAWHGYQSGNASVGNSDSYPYPFENSATINPNSLSLQVLASGGSPWSSRTLGIASFADSLIQVGSRGTSNECSLGICFRTGPMPTLTTVPRAWHWESEPWITIALQVEGASG